MTDTHLTYIPAYFYEGMIVWAPYRLRVAEPNRPVGNYSLKCKVIIAAGDSACLESVNPKYPMTGWLNKWDLLVRTPPDKQAGEQNASTNT